MSTQRSLERSIAVWMADEATGAASDAVLDNVMFATRRMRPRPRWLALLKEPPMRLQSRTTVGSPTGRLVLVLALLGVLLLGAVAAVAALQSRATPDDWPGLRRNPAHTSATDRGPVGNPVARWTFHAQGAIAANISIVGDLVLAPSDDGVLHALDITTGLERWSTQLAGPAGGPMVADGTVFLADGRGAMHALNLADGSERWPASVPLNSPTAPTVDGDRLIVGTGDGQLVALSTATGAIAWDTHVSAEGLPIDRVPAAADGRIFAGVMNGPFVAVQASDGSQLWSLPGNGAAYGTPVVNGNTLYVSGWGGLRALDVASGDARWQTDDYGTPAIAGDLGVGGTDTGSVIAYQLGTGAVAWEAQFAGPIRPAAVAGDGVYFTAEGEHRIYALDTATGNELWSFDLDGSNECCVAASHGLVVVGTLPGTLYAIDGDGATVAPQPHRTVVPPSSTPVPTTTPSQDSAPTPAPSPIADVGWQATSPEAGFVSAGMARAPDGRLWVADVDNGRFAIFGADGTYLESWGRPGDGKGEFNLRRSNGDPYGTLAFAADGSFFVLDVGNRRVQAFDASRDYITEWGGFGSSPGMFSDPVGIAVGPDGNVSVLDDVRSVVETYQPDGSVVGAFDPLEGVSNGANGLAVDDQGSFYVSAVGPNEVRRFDGAGNLTGTFGASGQGAFLDQPGEIAVDASGRVYVTQIPSSPTDNGVRVYAPDGSFLGSWGEPGREPGQLGFPSGIVVDDAGNAFVSEFGGDPALPSENRVQQFVLTLP